MYDNRYSMYVGRFQPFHEGHKWLIEKILKSDKRVCIAVMDIHESEPEKNPFKTEEVIRNISNQLKDLIDGGLVKIISIPPIESVNYGRTVGYDIIEHTPPEHIRKITATKIRRKDDINIEPLNAS
jgi:cytidyltransferase-like protein